MIVFFQQRGNFATGSDSTEKFTFNNNKKPLIFHMLRQISSRGRVTISCHPEETKTPATHTPHNITVEPRDLDDLTIIRDPSIDTNLGFLPLKRRPWHAFFFFWLVVQPDYGNNVMCNCCLLYTSRCV